MHKSRLDGCIRYVTYDTLPVVNILCVDANNDEGEEQWSIRSTVIGIVKGLGRYLFDIIHGFWPWFLAVTSFRKVQI